MIVCEKQGASWLPFEPLTEVKGLKTQNFQEAIWLKNTSLPKQVDLFGSLRNCFLTYKKQRK